MDISNMMEKDHHIKKDGMDSREILNQMSIQEGIKMDNMLVGSNMGHSKIIRKIILIKDLIKTIIRELVIKDTNTEEINMEATQVIKTHLVIMRQLLITC